MKKGKYFWIKERHNPQFRDPYYVACGRITTKEASEMEKKSIYGLNYMHKYLSEKEYEDKLIELRNSGNRVI